MARDPAGMQERRNRILESLKTDGFVMVGALAKHFGTTEVTIRSDLQALEREGLLRRMAGGAVPSRSEEQNSPGVPRLNRFQEEKKRIAAFAAKMIHDGERLFINSGSTTYAFAEALKEHKGLNIVTNSIQIARLLGDVHSFHVILIGGELNSYDGFTFGIDATDMLARYRAGYAVLSLDGINAESGISTLHAAEVSLNRMMMDHADQVLFVADHTKLGRGGFSNFAVAGNREILITDDGADRNVIADLEANGMTVLVAKD
ncbi:MAG: DeoR/GlpR transcriptional regulator [Lachnospiraceae bacterium]|nr:DeoR/GlpR transcriptional regulator [Lachnospiraceae bacterium]MBQ6541700.1 DeoR/GlpR transcriptional regulator [Lachnospiraceae bacterium]MBQ7602217.1 DeoR/GlpR transcriptional regulator [Lachnospiraceae bacterium]MBR5339158.1 DeoR/GlpR transcriptional regulator [Lachnospiraceae bacterium]